MTNQQGVVPRRAPPRAGTRLMRSCMLTTALLVAHPDLGNACDVQKNLDRSSLEHFLSGALGIWTRSSDPSGRLNVELCPLFTKTGSVSNATSLCVWLAPIIHIFPISLSKMNSDAVARLPSQDCHNDTSELLERSIITRPHGKKVSCSEIKPIRTARLQYIVPTTSSPAKQSKHHIDKQLITFYGRREVFSIICQS